MSFWNELKRRNVFKVGAAYLVVAWLITQVVATVDEPLNLPDSLDTIVILLLAIGFPVALLLAWAYELTPAGLKPTAEVDRDESITRLTGQRLNYVVTALLVLAVAFLAIDRFVVGRATATLPEAESTADEAGGPGPEIAPAVRGPSVAVLPFENLSSDPDQDYFADGISLELRDQLYNAEALYVTPRELVLPLKDSADPPAAIAAALGVANLLTGSIRKAGQTVRISAMLTQAEDGSRVWQQSFDGTLEQVLDFQAEIAAAVIEELTGSFDAVDVFPGGTDNEVAYDLYLRGKANAQPNEQLALYRQALALDPDFALAQIALADQLLSRADAMGSGAPEAITAGAESAVQRAVELAPGLVGAQLLVARQHTTVGDWIAAEQVYLALLEQTGDRDFEVHSRYGAFLVLVGRLTASIPYLQQARSLSPLSAVPPVFLAMVYDSLGQTGRADELTRIAEPLFSPTPAVKYGPPFWRAMYRQDYAEAARLGTLSGLRVDAGSLADRDAVLGNAREQFENPQQQLATIQQFVALFAANFSDVELAVSAWRKTLQSSSAYMSFFWTPLMTPVRTHPGIKDALREAGLVAYWQQAGWPDLCRPVGADDFECR